ncbi:16137_t:CDS:10 [Entrophospora sp. SA101]|nr:16137_t:CDS:10 [Entrophospora sp. SA101]CAJ0839638.1 6451_t:CDS:10 [Entrophospora sp. SA101]
MSVYDELSLIKVSLNEKELNLEELYSPDFQALHRFLRLLPYLDNSTRSKLLEKLRRLIDSNNHGQEVKDVKILVIMILDNLAYDSSTCFEIILTDLMNQVQSDSTELKCRVYDLVLNNLKNENLNISSSLLSKLKSFGVHAINDLTDSHYSLRSVFSGGNNIMLPNLNESEIQKIIKNFGNDPDPRVRSAALKALLQLNEYGYKLDISLYNLSVSCLADDYEEVRIEALNLICTIYPQSSMEDGPSQSIRLIDDAFIKVCDMVYDVSVKVRSKACKLMGLYLDVDVNVLLQTLSQQVITHSGKSKKVGHNKPKKGRYIPNPEGDIDVESLELRLLKSSASGAFIHGLEDAYQDVRKAAIDSIRELSMNNQVFAKRAVEFLVDMFQDEIDSVRLKSINSLKQIGENNPIELDSELLQIVLSVLNDSDPVVRVSTHRMLGVIRLKVSDLTLIFTQTLIKNMSIYPEDQLSIYECFRDFGTKHSDYIESYYISKEINQNSPEHIGNLILAFNASMPGNENKQNIQIDTDDKTHLLMQHTIDNILMLKRLFKIKDFRSSMRVIKVCTRICESFNTVPNFMLKTSDIGANLLKISYSIEHGFLELHNKKFIYNMRIIAYIVWLIGNLKNVDSNGNSALNNQDPLNLFIKRGTDIARLFEQNNHELNYLLDNLNKPPIEMNAIISLLFDYIKNFQLLDINPRNSLIKPEAIITRPTSNKKPVEFDRQFPLTVHIEADLFDLDDITTISIQVTLPDQSILNFRTSPVEFFPTKTYQYQLKTHIDISQSAWTESCYIIIKIVRSFELDPNNIDMNILRQNFSSANSIPCATTSTMTTQNTLDISSNPIKYFIWPKDTLPTSIS